MSKYQEYPKELRHPSEAPAVVSIWDEKLKRHVPEHGAPARFQPVTVHDRDQEEQYASKGYYFDGTPDSTAYEAAKTNSTPENYEFREYPKWVGNMLVSSREQEDSVRELEKKAEIVVAGKQANRERAQAQARA